MGIRLCHRIEWMKYVPPPVDTSTRGSDRTAMVPLHRHVLYMLGADVICGEETQEGCAVGRCFDRRPAFCFGALHQADDPDDAHLRGVSSFDGGDGRAAGGADIVDDEHRGILLRKAFDLSTRAVRLLRLADKKTMNESAFAGVRVALRAGDGDRRDNGVGAQGKATDGVRVEVMLTQQIEDGEAGKASALGVQRGGAAVDVVVAAPAGGELKVAELEGLAREKGEELLAVSGGSRHGFLEII